MVLWLWYEQISMHGFYISYACLWSSLHDVSTVNHLHLNKKSKVVRQIFIENNEKLIKLIKLIRRFQDFSVRSINL